MSEDRENQDNAMAGDSLLKPEESKENVAEIEISDNQALASPDGKPEVKYVNADSQNGDAKIEIENVRAVFAGMGKEELMRFANDPFWVRTRWILFSLFWFLWFAMLVGAIGIIFLAPSCAARKDPKWWERSPLYEVNIRSFKDGSRMADGVGDLEGLRSKLDYIKDLGVSGVILSSVYATGSDQSPESVTDFKAVHPDFGTPDEFKKLVEDMKAKDLRVVLDLVPNHSGKEHKWFQDSIKKIPPYKDYYVWSSGKGSDSDQKNVPPNNWKSVTGGSAWEWNELRNEFYLHQFEVGQPDLNFRNPAVQEEFKGIMKYWLDLGVQGFQLGKTPFLVEDERLQDEAIGTKPGSTHDSYDFFNHKHTAYLFESFKLVGEWRSVVSNASSKNILLLRDEFPLLDLVQNQEAANSTATAGDLLQTPEFLLSTSSNFSVSDLSGKIRNAIDRSPSHKPVWRLGDGNSSRLASRFSGALAEAMMMITLVLPGTPIIYYGDEIGLTNVPQSSNNRALAPMEWNSSAHAGFTSDTIKPWISVSNTPGINVAAQLLAEESHLKTFKELLEARRTLVAITLGKTNLTVLNATRSDGTVSKNSVLAITRLKSGNPGVLLAVNPSKEALTVNLGTIADIAEELTVHLKSSSFSDKNLQVKGKTQRDAVLLPPESGIMFTFVYKKEDGKDEDV